MPTLPSSSGATHAGEHDPLAGYRFWFYAAALYNLLWGSLTILFPQLFFHLIHMPVLDTLPLWQCIGMFVLVYAPAYWWAGRYPSRYRHLILIGLLGKVLGPIGFVWAYTHGQLPLAFGLTNLTNDVIWWPAFVSYLHTAARLSGGWIPFVLGE
jgi:small multidrug resistance pump